MSKNVSKSIENVIENMNIKELKYKIKDLPDNMDVMIEQTNNEFRCTVANEANVLELTFSDGELKGSDICLLISD